MTIAGTAWQNSVSVGISLLRRVSPLHFQSFTLSSNLSFSPHFPRSTPRTFAVSMANESRSGVVGFKVSPSTDCVIQKGDITKWFIDGSSDAIVVEFIRHDSNFHDFQRMTTLSEGVEKEEGLSKNYYQVDGSPKLKIELVNPANEVMLGGGGADGAIHNAAGPDLVRACYSVQEVQPGIRCPTGEARITPGFRLPASHVIHTVGPIYNASRNPQALLRSAYRNSLAVAKENNIQYIAFPAISCGVFRYPYDEAATIALSTIKEFSQGLKEVRIFLGHSVAFFTGVTKDLDHLPGGS
ncbi:appr-1-p processing enzyme family protein [Cucumis melo var. makuwa]|uniref:Appr-1-p processing enzyme family protein n=1 Tax=Cucumis melo var. makuwa TaxID=1194695 RepID=A0A5D3DG28_CUCMM|nr:appr-1-p processing enzyme family protein [Cucumis melo var. makuwa]